MNSFVKVQRLWLSKGYTYTFCLVLDAARLQSWVKDVSIIDELLGALPCFFDSYLLLEVFWKGKFQHVPLSSSTHVPNQGKHSLQRDIAAQVGGPRRSWWCSGGASLRFGLQRLQRPKLLALGDWTWRSSWPHSCGFWAKGATSSDDRGY